MALTDAERSALEAKYTARRIVELQLDPVSGKFDSAHLREINRRIFQDLPGHGLTDVTPGQYRAPVPEGRDWLKMRALENVKTSTFVAYSRMDESAVARLDALLDQIDPKAMARLDPPAFSYALADLRNPRVPLPALTKTQRSTVRSGLWPRKWQNSKPKYAPWPGS